MLSAVLLSAFLISLIGGTVFWLRTSQIRKLNALQLTPNCLLTRYPLVFLTGHRSVFYFFNYWNLIPDFLKEHGYQVQVWHLPWRNREQRKATLLRYIEQCPRPVHILGDQSIHEELNWLNAARNSQIATITEVQCTLQKSIKVTDLKPLPVAPLHLQLSDRIQMKPSDILKPIFWTRCLLRTHNALGFASQPIEAVNIGLHSKAWEIESQFLSHAISLAEKDLQ
jgi:hypothetical protein